jgi:hypothetical protein
LPQGNLRFFSDQENSYKNQNFTFALEKVCTYMIWSQFNLKSSLQLEHIILQFFSPITHFSPVARVQI